MISWLKDNMLSCPYKATWGLDCLGCGMQRSIIALLEGDLSTSIQLYPALLPLLILLTYTGLHLKYKYLRGAQVVMWLFASTVTINLGHFLFFRT